MANPLLTTLHAGNPALAAEVFGNDEANQGALGAGALDVAENIAEGRHWWAVTLTATGWQTVLAANQSYDYASAWQLRRNARLEHVHAVIIGWSGAGNHSLYVDAAGNNHMNGPWSTVAGPYAVNGESTDVWETPALAFVAPLNVRVRLSVTGSPVKGLVSAGWPAGGSLFVTLVFSAAHEVV